MADFTTHITASTLVGAAYAAAGHVHWNVPIPTCMVAAGLCSLAGMLPDVDSDTGRPQQELMSFFAAVTPMMLLDHFANLGLARESIVLASGCVYILIRFGLGELLKRYTIHRGMWHSIPAAVAAGLATSLFCSCDHIALRFFKVFAVVLGFLVHLALDELWAFSWSRGRPRFKRTFGSALKFFDRRWLPNMAMYAVLMALVVLNLGDPLIQAQLGMRPESDRHAARRWIEQLLGQERREIWRETSRNVGGS